MKEPLRCRAPAAATVEIDDAHVRVTRWDFEAGAETGWHRHGMAYVVVPVTAFILYVLASVELIAEEIEDPFHGDPNDLPTAEMAGKIEETVLRTLA